MEREHHPSNKAWIALVAGVAIYDYLAPVGETMSEGFDRYLRHPLGRIAAIGAVALTSAHLLNVYERFGMEQVDPIHQLAVRFRHE